MFRSVCRFQESEMESLYSARSRAMARGPMFLQPVKARAKARPAEARVDFVMNLFKASWIHSQRSGTSNKFRFRPGHLIRMRREWLCGLPKTPLFEGLHFQNFLPIVMPTDAP